MKLNKKLVCGLDEIKESTIIQNVYKTKEYKFSTLEGNRNLNELHVERLKRSMKEHHLVSPIIVNEEGQIIDGQHRYEASKQLKLPLYYIVCEGYSLPEIQRLNQISNSWTSKDFLQGYCNLEKPDYITLRDLLSKHNISVNLAIELTNRNHVITDVLRDFKAGNYIADDVKWAEKFLGSLEIFKDYFPDYKVKNFIKAYMRIYKLDKYNHKTMVRTIAIKGHQLEKRNTINQYLNELLDIYNYRTKDSEKIYIANGVLV